MASTAILQRLQQRANQADQIIAQLKTKLETLKQAAVANGCLAEEEKLRVENEKLKKEVNQLKNKLIQAEVRNGVKQVPLPQSSAVVLTSKPVVQQMVAAKTTAPSSNNSSQPQKKKEKKEKVEKKGGKQDQAAAPEAPVDVSRLDMRIGQIVNVKKHPDADSLYVEEVNLGEETTRTIVSGLVKHVPLEEMQNRIAIFMCNLKAAKMRGILSQGMIMCGSTPDKVEIIVPPEGSVPGDRITFEGYEGTPDALLNPKKKIWEQVQPDLRINSVGVATYKGVPFQVVGRNGLCKVPSLKETPIK